MATQHFPTASEPRGNPLTALRQYGQSVWLDLLRRSLVQSGELARLIAEDGLTGITSNPAIFQKAIEGNDDYAAAIAELAKKGQASPRQLFEALAVADVRGAADVLAPVYEESQGADGFVSLEVAPDLARDTRGSIEEGRRLWRSVDRPNLMIKVPATAEGLPAVLTLLTEGINVNITLLFARGVYEQVAEAYLAALEQRLRAGQRIDRVASVASFFVSRIDTAVDERIHRKLPELEGSARAELEGLAGKVAIANAKLAYQSYRKIFSGPRWEALSAAGARPQRLLWASTGTKNPRYSDVLYVDELIGTDTVNTMPPETLAAYRDHGQPRATLESGLSEARQVLDRLARAGISLEEVTEELAIDGVHKFVEPYERLLTAIAQRLHGHAR
jgi:transaldolase / glucose-6-phosphate isomerase